MAQHGGKREGAGRKKGSYTRPQIRDYFTQEDIETLVADIKVAAQEDIRMKQWLGDHIFGRAVQSMEHTGKDGESLFDHKTKESTQQAIKSFIQPDGITSDIGSGQ